MSSKGFNAGAAPFVPTGASPAPEDGGQQHGSVFGQQQALLNQHQSHGGHMQHHQQQQQSYGGYGGGGGGGYGGYGGYGGQQGTGMTLVAAGAAAPGVSIEMFDAEVKAQLSLPADSIFFTAGAAAGCQPGARGPAVKHKVCASFVAHGGCRLGEGCRDVHPLPMALDEARQRVYAWMAAKEEEFTTRPEATYKVFYSDLKEVISVPAHALAFTRGLFLDPADREKRPAGHAPQPRTGNPTIAQQAPTACGLYANNPASCKWGKYCNQAHVSAEWIDSHRRQFEQWSSSLEAQFHALPDDSSFVVHDPIRRVLLRVPKYHIAEFTRGLLQSTTDKCPSVCLLSLQARCTASRRCNQAHINPVWLAEQNETGEAIVSSDGDHHQPMRQTSTHSLGGTQHSFESTASAGSGPRMRPATIDPGHLEAANHQQQQYYQQQQQRPQHQHHAPPQPTYIQQHQQQPQYQLQPAYNHHDDAPTHPDLPPDAPQPPRAAGDSVGGTGQAPRSNAPPAMPLPSPLQKFSRRAELGGHGAASPSTPPDAGGPAPAPQHPGVVSPIRPPGKAMPGAPGSGPGPSGGFSWGAFRTPDSAGHGAAFPEHFSTPTQQTPNTGARLTFSFPGGMQGAVSPLMRSTTNAPNTMKVSLTGFDEVFSGGPPDAGDLSVLPPPASAHGYGNAQAQGMPGAQGPRQSSAPSTPLAQGKSPNAKHAAPRNPRFSPGGRPMATLGAPPPADQ